MNTKSKVLIGLMAICLLGTVGSTLALTRSGASVSGNPGAFDKAIYLGWGDNETSVTINNVENLGAGEANAQYRGLTLGPESTKSLEGVVRLTFTLAASAGNHHINGLTISVYNIDDEFDAENVATQIDGKTASPVLDAENLTGTTDLEIEADEESHRTVGYYAIKVLWSGANDAEHPTYTLDASLTISQSFVTAQEDTNL